MINSANTVDFNAISHGSVLLQSGMMPLDKCKIVHTSKIPQSTDERFTSTYSIQTSLVAASYAVDNKLKNDIQSAETKDIQMQPQRVQVQHLQIHPNLQNNRWSYHTFYNLSNELDRTQLHDGSAIRISKQNNNLKLEKQSAFSINSNVKVNSNNNNNNNNTNNNNNNTIITNIPNTFSQIESGKNLSGNLIVRTIDKEDAHRELSYRRSSSFNNIDYQENAFLRIKDVHNYAKLDHYSYSNESSNSSMHDEENEDDDDDLDEDMDDNNDDAATNYERYLKNSKHFAARKNKSNRLTRMETETEHNVDVETVHKVQNNTEGAMPSTPDHHARRPMNAFLIFCKRHRAIVKERYKSLENRAITKILGDWWASLDGNDKKCFTNLAQQNKDAFFNANPNFKWYKLPAPPLRTLNTRPGNSEHVEDQDNEVKSMIVAQDSGALLHKFPNDKNNHLFKLADEAQMGELSTLINCEGSNNNCNSNQNTNALQQALGETSQFLNAYMPPSSDTSGVQSSKVRLLNENSFSSNGSEDDMLPKKSARACKGKIYQELINSGQISAVSKKIKIPKSVNYSNGINSQTVSPFNQVSLEGSINSTASAISNNNAKQCETHSLDGSHSNNDLMNFDLEEKIKELPALSLDLYLQRKRNTKKKKKFTSKKRHSNSAANNNKSSSAINEAHTPVVTLSSNKIRASPPQQAVGSQKRKARKESITRRDVTAIENEIASVIPLAKSFNTINGCYYFNESPDSTLSKSRLLGEVSNSTVATAANSQRTNGFVNLNNDNISSTSDLLILAEVAANRTELAN